MCYHASTPKTELLRDIIKGMTVQNGFKTIYHVSGFTRPFLPVTLNNDIDSIVSARWKLIPSWIKSEEAAEKSGNTLNARSEEIFERSSYKNAITRQRGLLYVQGFFEPHATDGKNNDETYYIQDPTSPIFTLGVVWSRWQNYNTFSIITTPANTQMEEIHNVGKRMPLIIPEIKRHNWLLADGRDEIESLMVPYEGQLQTHRTFRVTSARGIDTNIPSIQDVV
ncbi:SOS response-associated peptidase [Sphingobacterium shayense]|uniref:SOS response-associated peptidase n=1 Tax=Sphingobacterium shayense TaxID=626343 RepID=UPI0015549C5E|nr:SOS response-associated peptidase family protein [Sphingobacterium shayense]NQD71639.1 SOS response-associated peptidase [Sphingobacterium shayense]